MNADDDILIVDDEAANLRLLAGLLEREGYRVRPAERPQTAIDSALDRKSSLPPSMLGSTPLCLKSLTTLASATLEEVS